MNLIKAPRLARSPLPALMLALCAAALPALSHADARSITVVQKPLTTLTVPASDLKVSTWVNRQDALYVPGDKVQIYFKASQSAYVTVLNVDAEGNTTVLFPNRFASNNRVKGGAVIKLPADGAAYDLQVGKPYGSNLIKVIATTDKAGIVPQNAQRAIEGTAFNEVTSSVQELSRSIQVVVNQKPQAKWAMAEFPIGVVARRSQPVSVTVADDEAATVVTTTVQPSAAQTTVTTTVSTPASQPAPEPVVVAPLPAVAVAVAPAPAAVALPAMQSDFLLSLATTKTSYASDESMIVTVTPEKRCRLSLLNITPEGQYQVIYPHTLEGELVLAGGRTTVLPGADNEFSLKATGTGRNHLVALCSEKKGLLGALFGTGRAVLGVKPLSLSQVLALQGDGRVARAVVAYDVN